MGRITHAVIGAHWVVRPKRRPPFRASLHSKSIGHGCAAPRRSSPTDRETDAVIALRTSGHNEGK